MEKNPYIGQLDRKITVLREVFAQNTTGEQKPTLEVVSDTWAFMEEQSGDEDVEGKVRHLINRRYTIRYNSTIATTGTKLKVVDNNVSYNIYHVKEIGRKQHLQLLVASYE